MIEIKKTKLEIDEEIIKRINIICEFSKYKPKFINGSINQIDKTNIAYIEPHKIIIKNIPILIFNGSKDIYIGNLNNKYKLNELEKILKTIKVFS